MKKQNIKVIGYVISCLSGFLLCREVYHYFTLPSINEISELTDLIKCKEGTINQGILLSLFLFFGIGIIRQNILGWILPQAILLIGIVFFLLVLLANIKIGFLILAILYLLFCIIIFRYFIFGKPKKYFNIQTSKIPYYYIFITIITVIYWTIEFNIY